MTHGRNATNRPLSIVFLVPRFHTNLFFATKALVEAGHKIHLICSDRATLEDHSFVTPHYVQSDISLAEVWTLLRELSPDLLFIRDVPGLSRKFMIAGVGQRRCLYAYDQHPVSRRRSVRKCVNDLLRGRPLRRVTPVPGLQHPVTPSRFSYYLPFPVEQTQAQVTEGKFAHDVVRILCVGKLAQPRKNHLLLMEALSGINAGSPFRVTLAGSTGVGASGGSLDHLNRLRNYAQDGPLTGRLSILEDVPFGSMPKLYATHDICVLPSVDEPLGTAPLEAMAFGCIPIISDLCGSAGYLPSNKVGLVVPGGDAAQLRIALSELIGMPRSRLRAMSGAAQELAATELSVAMFVRRIETLASRGRA